MKKLLLLIALVSTASCQSNVGDAPAGGGQPDEMTAARSVCLGGSQTAPAGFNETFDVITAIIIAARNEGIPHDKALNTLEMVCNDSCRQTTEASICDRVCTGCITAVVDAVY